MDCIVELAVSLGSIFPLMFMENFGVKCMFSTTFMDPYEWLANTSTISSPLSICAIIIVRDYIVESCSNFRNNISTNVYQNFGVKCMFSTTFMDRDVWLANTSTITLHSGSV